MSSYTDIEKQTDFLIRIIYQVLENFMMFLTLNVYVSTHKQKIIIPVQASSYRYGTPYSYGDCFIHHTRLVTKV